MNDVDRPAALSRQKFITALVAIGLVALLMRVVIGEVLRPIAHDGAMTGTYFNYAQNLIDHGIYSRSTEGAVTPDSMRMPLYPIFLASIRLMSGAEQWKNWVIAIQYVLGALVCVLIALLGAQVASAFVGIVSGILAAFYVDYYYLSIVFLRETLALFLFLLFLNCYVCFMRRRELRWAYAGAFFYGIGMLSRPESLLVGLFLAIFDYDVLFSFFNKNLRALALVSILALGPWMIWIGRNGVVQKHLVAFSTDGAWTLFMGQVYPPDEAYSVADPLAIKIINSTPVEYDWYKWMNQQALHELLSHPLRNAHWAWIKIQQTFLEYTNNGLSFLYPLLWMCFPWLAFRRHRYKYFLIAAGIVAGVLHLRWGNWDSTVPMGLLHTKFSDIVIPGALGFSMMILQKKNTLWKAMAASFLTLIVSVVIFIALLRSRLVLCDWILMIGAAYALEEGIKICQGSESN